MEILWDVIIVGSGPAGMSAAIYTSRAMLKTLIIEKLGPGGQAALTESIENYAGFSEPINGFELSVKMEEQARKFGAEIENGEVQSVRKSDGSFVVTADDHTYQAKSVILATGVSPKKLDLPNELKFIGRGISFCATCDANFYRDKIVAVVGGGDAAAEEAMYLTKFATKVYLIHRRDQLRAEKIVQERAFKNEKLEFVWDSVVDEIQGDKSITGLRVKNVKTGANRQLDVVGVFLYIGGTPNTSMIEGVETDSGGYIVTDAELQTTVEGLFVCGDCRSKSFRQVATAVGDGAVAAHSCEKYIEKNK